MQKKCKADINYKMGLSCFSAEMYFLTYQLNSMQTFFISCIFLVESAIFVSRRSGPLDMISAVSLVQKMI